MAKPTNHLTAACRVAADLAILEVACALVGGVAVMLHGRVRTTKDVDFAVQAATDKVAERVVHDLSAQGYRIGQVMVQKESSRIATVRLFTPETTTDEPDCDLLFATCGIEPEIVREARLLPMPGGIVLRAPTTGQTL